MKAARIAQKILARRATRAVGFSLTLFLLGASAASAQDKATLDLLVKKGVISQQEADAVAKPSALADVTAKNPAVQKIKLEGMLQIQFDSVTTKDSAHANPSSADQFELRHLYFGAVADLGNGWSGELEADFAATGSTQMSGAPQSQNTQNLLEKAIITKQVDDYGAATFGFQKTQFSYEENTLTSEILPVERSIATNYFTRPYNGPTTGRLGFGNRLSGIYWEGHLPGDSSGFYYGAALTDGIESAATTGNAAGGAPSYNEFGYWGHAGYKGVVDGVNYKVGLNAGYASEANSIATQNNAVYGYNPYLSLNYGRASLVAEYLQAIVQNGRSNATGATSNAAPYGINITPSYKINAAWELVSRFSYLSTNGRGALISQQEWDAANTAGTNASGTAGSDYDNVWAAYIGANWSIVGNSVKLSAGYEFAQFTDRQSVANGPFNGPHANVSALRARLQLLF
jgi:hypothetical protein